MEGEGVKKDQAGEEGEKGEPDYDPFTGAPLRRLIPLQASLPSFTGSTSAPGPGGTATPAEPSLSHQLWSHLATVRRLQAELAAQHIAMEDVTGRSGSGRGGALGGAGPRDLSSEQAARNMGEEGEATREERGRERQEAVKGIMSKLDELSRAVTAYHGVVTPSLDLAPSPGRTRSTTLSHGTPAHDGAFSDSALSELGPRGGGGDALGLGRVGSGWELGRRGSGRGMLGEDVVESPIGGSHGFEI
ncbi:hypothetical protein CALCODRAFT_496953 [Calocera cornea HHB12733]|uniref:Uncharacterized protein n=1 Tax=Calocera cornea HHB12733 TaxID=1353952 RepID=A0A165FIG2_9BASI|nr:hypothetical protein CALCODRAFT_496953 [Calocera cornea HHB12733]